jgi:competence protein ComEC
MALREYSFTFPVSISISFFVSFGWGALGTSLPNRSSLPAVTVLCVIAAAGAVYISSALSETDAPAIVLDRVSSRGTVLIARKWGFGKAVLVNSSAGRFLLKFGRYDDDGVSAGDIVKFSGVPRRLERASERGEFDEFLYWRAKGASLAIEGPEISKIGESFGFARWRSLLARRVARKLPPRTAGYLLAALTGTKDESLENLHRLAGTSHLLAVSGAHVGIVFCVFWFFLRRFRLRLFLISAVIWAYIALAGAAPSAVRAGVMIQLAIVGRIVGRSGKPFNTVSAAGALMLLQNPWIFWEVGWRLSIIAVLALSSLAAMRLSAAAGIFLSSPLVWLATSLQSSWTFESSPAAGIAANLFALPAFSVLFPLAFVFSIPSLAGLPFGRVFAAVPEFLFTRWERLSLNLLVLFPWEVAFSAALLVTGAAVLTYLFAKASGFSSFRSLLAVTVNAAGLFSLLFLM